MVAVTRVRLGYNNAYLVEHRGGRVLVDTGPDYAGAWETLEAELPGRPHLVVATHGHHDHAGLGRHWQEAGVPVAVHEDDHEFAGHVWLHDKDVIEGMVRMAEESGAPPEIAAEMTAVVRRRAGRALEAAVEEEHPSAEPGARWPTGLRYRPFEPVGLPETIGAGLWAMHTPGHTPGNIVLVLEEEGLLFSGDQLLPDIKPSPTVHGAPDRATTGEWRAHSLPPFLEGLERLMTMRFERCYPGHGEPFEAVSDVIASNIVLIERRTERVREVLRDGPKTPWAVCEALYPRVAARRPWQILGTVTGYLDLLEVRGLAALRDSCYEAV